MRRNRDSRFGRRIEKATITHYHRDDKQTLSENKKELERTHFHNTVMSVRTRAHRHSIAKPHLDVRHQNGKLRAAIPEAIRMLVSQFLLKFASIFAVLFP